MTGQDFSHEFVIRFSADGKHYLSVQAASGQLCDVKSSKSALTESC